MTHNIEIQGVKLELSTQELHDLYNELYSVIACVVLVDDQEKFNGRDIGLN